MTVGHDVAGLGNRVALGVDTGDAVVTATRWGVTDVIAGDGCFLRPRVTWDTVLGFHEPRGWLRGRG
jgi:hypothetical protein